MRQVLCFHNRGVTPSAPRTMFSHSGRHPGCAGCYVFTIGAAPRVRRVLCFHTRGGTPGTLELNIANFPSQISGNIRWKDFIRNLSTTWYAIDTFPVHFTSPHIPAFRNVAGRLPFRAGSEPVQISPYLTSGPHPGASRRSPGGRPEASRSTPQTSRSTAEASRRPPGALRRHPGAPRSFPEASRRFPGASRRLPGGFPEHSGATRSLSEASRKHPGGIPEHPEASWRLPEAPRSLPFCSLLACITVSQLVDVLSS